MQVFKVAKIMAPSVIYIDECEKVFVTDKKKMKELGGSEPFSRIKKDILKEVKALTPEERVLVIGNSSEPHMCVKKDEKAFVSFWDKHIYLPLPDYSSRRVLWPELFKRHQGHLPYTFDLSTLSHLSERFATGTMEQVSVADLAPLGREIRAQVVETIMSAGRRDPLERGAVTLEEIHKCMSLFEPVAKREDAEMRAWTEKLPNRGTSQGQVSVSAGQRLVGDMWVLEGRETAGDGKKAKAGKK